MQSPVNATTDPLWAATLNSLRRLNDGIRTERAVRQEAIVLVIGLAVGIAIAPSVGWYVAMIAALLGTLAVEFLNTAVEKLADRLTREEDVAIGRVKDFGSAAVLCMLCLDALTWGAALALRLHLF
jgi:diacylglycerol kinase (ATP)